MTPATNQLTTPPEGSTDEVQLMFSSIIHSETLSERRKVRVSMMLALRRLILHSNNVELLSLETSSIGQWCLQSLNSSVRELRIAAGRLLAAFMLERTYLTEKDLVYRNRKNAIALLRTISEKHQPNLAETCIMAWGQLGRVVSEDELNLVLIKLLEYLGNSNNIVSAFAFNELLNLSEARASTPRHLFEPFWNNLAYIATKEMVHRPQTSRAIAELLQISVNELLLLIQKHALPWLVLDRRKDVIQKIAEARQEHDIWRPLMDSSNLAATIALLLVQDTDDAMSFAKSRLDSIHPHFTSLTLLHLVQSEPVLIIMELLKAAGDADDIRKELVSNTLLQLELVLTSPGSQGASYDGLYGSRY